jgi:hypothetical protein
MGFCYSKQPHALSSASISRHHGADSTWHICVGSYGGKFIFASLLPIHAYRSSNETLQAGIEEHAMDGVLIKFYCVEKTLADCFRFRNRIGMDVVLEALKLYKVRMKFNHGELLKYVRICRVEKVMRPYLEAMI